MVAAKKVAPKEPERPAKPFGFPRTADYLVVTRTGSSVTAPTT